MVGSDDAAGVRESKRGDRISRGTTRVEQGPRADVFGYPPDTGNNGVGDCVADGLRRDGPAFIERIMPGLGEREARAPAEGPPDVKSRLGQQFQSILSSVRP